MRPRASERLAGLPGDDLVPSPDAVMDRAFDLPVPPEAVWPWFGQLGKNRAGWYLPAWVETFVPRRRRALRHIDPSLQGLRPGDVIDDWGGRDATFEIVVHDAPHVLVHRSTRGHLSISWAIRLSSEGSGTRVHLRFRIGGVKRPWLVVYGGGLIDLLTVAGLAAGLRERVRI
ncbi:SRPBCC family protein [Herbidospora sp. RD11066]